MIDEQRAAFESWLGTTPCGAAHDLALEAWQAALASPEVQALREALEQCRFALEPYDDVKPRDWKSDRENLRYAHQAVCAALAAMEKKK